MEVNAVKNDENYYVDPLRLRELIREYKTKLLENPNHQMSDELGIYLLKLARKFSSRSCFSGYTYREDFEMESVAKMIKAVEKIDPDDPRSPFGYLTQTCFRTIINFIKKEKKYTQNKDSMAERIYNEYAQEFGLKELHNPNYDEETSGPVSNSQPDEDDLQVDSCES